MKPNTAIFDEMSINSQNTSTPKTSSLNIETESDTPTRGRIKTSTRQCRQCRAIIHCRRCRKRDSQMTAEQMRAEAEELERSWERSRERSKSRSHSQLSDASSK